MGRNGGTMVKINLAVDLDKARLKELKDKGIDKLSKKEINELLNTILKYLKIV